MTVPKPLEPFNGSDIGELPDEPSSLAEHILSSSSGDEDSRDGEPEDDGVEGCWNGDPFSLPEPNDGLKPRTFRSTDEGLVVDPWTGDEDEDYLDDVGLIR